MNLYFFIVIKILKFYVRRVHFSEERKMVMLEILTMWYAFTQSKPF